MQSEEVSKIEYGKKFIDRQTGWLMWFGSFLTGDGLAQRQANVEKYKAEGGKYPEVIREFEALDLTKPICQLMYKSGTAIMFCLRNLNDLEPYNEIHVYKQSQMFPDREDLKWLV